METIEQMKFARGYTLGRLSKLEGADWDRVHPGFSNNIRWNAGHIFVSLENFAKMIAPDYEIEQPEWAGLFNTGTSPVNWDEVQGRDFVRAEGSDRPHRRGARRKA